MELHCRPEGWSQPVAASTKIHKERPGTVVSGLFHVHTAMTTPDRPSPTPPYVPRAPLPRRLKAFTAGLLNVVLVGVIAVAAIGVVGTVLRFWEFDVVLSGSMRLSINPGDVEVLFQERDSAIRVGQVVGFHPPHEPNLSFTHRIVAVMMKDGHYWIRTKGDANDVADPWGDVEIINRTVWYEKAVIPKVGYVIVWVDYPLIRDALILVLVGVCAAYGIKKVWST